MYEEETERLRSMNANQRRYAIWVLYTPNSGGLAIEKLYAPTLDEGLRRFEHKHLQMGELPLAYVIRRARDNDTLMGGPLGGGFKWNLVAGVRTMDIGITLEPREQPVEGIHVQIKEAK